MNSFDKDTLRRNYSELVDGMQDVEAVVNLLVQWGILNRHMKTDIMEKQLTTIDGNRALLDILTRRGPDCFQKFCEALQQSGEEREAKVLTLPASPHILLDPRCHLELGGDIYVMAKVSNDILNIHIRKYDVYSSGKSYPNKRGIVLTLKHCLELPGAIRIIEEAVKEGKSTLQYHLGANVFVVMDDTGIDIRQCCWDNSVKIMVPSVKGILLSMDQWKKLGYCVEVMYDFVPELKDMVPCMLQEDHQNQIGALRCSFCNPNESECWNDLLFYYGCKSPFSTSTNVQ